MHVYARASDPRRSVVRRSVPLSSNGQYASKLFVMRARVATDARVPPPPTTTRGHHAHAFRVSAVPRAVFRLDRLARPGAAESGRTRQSSSEPRADRSGDSLRPEGNSGAAQAVRLHGLR